MRCACLKRNKLLPGHRQAVGVLVTVNQVGRLVRLRVIKFPRPPPFDRGRPDRLVPSPLMTSRPWRWRSLSPSSGQNNSCSFFRACHWKAAAFQRFATCPDRGPFSTSSTWCLLIVLLKDSELPIVTPEPPRSSCDRFGPQKPSNVCFCSLH